MHSVPSTPERNETNGTSFDMSPRLTIFHIVFFYIFLVATSLLCKKVIDERVAKSNQCDQFTPGT